jgi:hypothetical protein
MTNLDRPTRLKIADLPRDEKRVLGGLRTALIHSFNFSRRYPLKLAVLEETLRYVHGRVRLQQEADGVLAEAKALAAEKAKAPEKAPAEVSDAPVA